MTILKKINGTTVVLLNTWKYDTDLEFKNLAIFT